MATAGIVTVTTARPTSKVQIITFTIVASVDAATVPTTASGRVFGTLLFVDTIPGATNPTAAYDIVFNNADGIDIMGGALADRSATTAERAVALNNSVPYICWINGGFDLVLTNNAVNSANIIVKVFVDMYK